MCGNLTFLLLFDSQLFFLLSILNFVSQLPLVTGAMTLECLLHRWFYRISCFHKTKFLLSHILPCYHHPTYIIKTVTSNYNCSGDQTVLSEYHNPKHIIVLYIGTRSLCQKVNLEPLGINLDPKSQLYHSVLSLLLSFAIWFIPIIFFFHMS